MQEERILHEAKLSKMEAEMKMVFQQKVQEKESKLKQSEEELYARHKEMKDALDKQRSDLEDKKRRIESGRPLTPEKNTVSAFPHFTSGVLLTVCRPKIVASSGRKFCRVGGLVRCLLQYVGGRAFYYLLSGSRRF